MLLKTVYSHMCGMFYQHFLNYKVTMTTYCDEIEAGMATSFNNLCSATFTEIRLIFMISMIFQRAPRATVFNIIFTKLKKIIAQNTLKLHTRPKENEQKNIYIWSHHPK